MGIVGKVIVALKDALVARGMADKLITYTPRYNAFIQGGAYNSNEFRTDGEGIDIGFESGPQAYTGVSGGVEHEKSIISYIMDRVGGVMFWAANEAAIASNGVTTGENSGTLAAYAAEEYSRKQ